MFILRRSAGFAYSFMSLLRAEPLKCKPTLLPLAMSALLGHVEAALLGLSEELLAESESTAVRSSTGKIVVERLEGLNRSGGGAGGSGGSDSIGATMEVESELLDASVLGDQHINVSAVSSTVADSGSSWRVCVHALNVLRLILSDAALGPDLDPFIARCAEMAVRGFRSTKWAVRNSAMMVFAAMVQRAVDNQKNESGGAKAATVQEFFQRFPSLYPFLLTELAEISGYDVQCVHGWPVNVVALPQLQPHGLKAEVATGGHANDQHPSLYPVLLLIAKLRSAVLGNCDSTSPTPSSTVTPSDKMSESASAVSASASISTTTLLSGAHNPVNISLFIPLVERCSVQKSQKVREMAARALAALIPLQSVANKVAEILEALTDDLHNYHAARRSLKSSTAAVTSSFSAAVPAFSFNDVHGRISSVYELSEGLRRHLNGIGDNRTFHAEMLLSMRTRAVDSLTRFAVTLRGPSGRELCAPVTRVLLRAIKVMVDIFGAGDCSRQLSEPANMTCTSAPLTHAAGHSAPAPLPTVRDLLVHECTIVYHRLRRLTAHDSVSGFIPPYEPVLWREALNLLTSTLLRDAVVSSGADSGCEGTQSSTSNIISLMECLDLLNHSTSEVREGVLLGIQAELLVQDQQSAVSQAVADATIDYLIDSCDIFARLVRRAREEREPPIANLTMQLLSR